MHHFGFRVSINDASGCTRHAMNTYEADFVLWAKMPYWSADEVILLLLGIDPAFAAEVGGIPEYDNRLEMAIRAIKGGLIPYPYTPRRWLAWAKKFNIPIPPELQKQVERFWPEEQSAVSARICDETACLKQLTEMMKSAPDNPRPKAEVRQEQFSNLPERTFNRAWSNAVRSADTQKWSAAGPRKKTPSPNRCT